MNKQLSNAIVALVVAAVPMACAQAPDLEKVPVGAEVQLTRKDGGVVQGKLAERDAEVVKVSTRSATKMVPREQVADVQLLNGDKPPVLPAIAKYREYNIPAGTNLHLAIATTLSSDSNKVDDPIEATVTTPVVMDGVDVVPAGSTLRGVVTDAHPAGKVKGVASLRIRFTTLAAHGDWYAMSGGWTAEGKSTKGKDAAKIGIGAGAGAIIGGLINGGKGAAAGAAIGGGGGTALVLTSKGKPLVLSSGDQIAVVLAGPLEIKVPIR